MGLSNVCLNGSCEGLFYVDNENLHVYSKKGTDGDWGYALLRDIEYQDLQNWEFNKSETEETLEFFVSAFADELRRKTTAFSTPAEVEWLDRTKKVILESKLFYICLEDNEWSLAVELVQKEEPMGQSWMENLQKRLYKKYLDLIRDCLLGLFPDIYIRTGPYTSGKISKREVLAV